MGGPGPHAPRNANAPTRQGRAGAFAFHGIIRLHALTTANPLRECLDASLQIPSLSSVKDKFKDKFKDKKSSQSPPKLTHDT